MAGVFVKVLRDERIQGRRDPDCLICGKEVHVGTVYWYHTITMECYHIDCFSPKKELIIMEE